MELVARIVNPHDIRLQPARRLDAEKVGRPGHGRLKRQFVREGPAGGIAQVGGFVRPHKQRIAAGPAVGERHMFHAQVEHAAVVVEMQSILTRPLLELFVKP